MCSPFEANARAAAKPIPDADPVMMATRPAWRAGCMIVFDFEDAGCLCDFLLRIIMRCGVKFLRRHKSHRIRMYFPPGNVEIAIDAAIQIE